MVYEILFLIDGAERKAVTLMDLFGSSQTDNLVIVKEIVSLRFHSLNGHTCCL